MRSRVTRSKQKLKKSKISQSGKKTRKLSGQKSQRGGAGEELRKAITEHNLGEVETILKNSDSGVSSDMLTLAIDSAIAYHSEEVRDAYLHGPLTVPDYREIDRKFETSDAYKIIEILLIYINPATIPNFLVDLVKDGTPIAIFKILLANPQFDPAADDNALLMAVVKTFTKAELLKLLLADPRIDPAARDNEALFLAEKYDNYDSFKLLMEDPRTDPGARNNQLIQNAVNYGMHERDWIAYTTLLLKSPKVDPAANREEALEAIARKYDYVNENEENPKDYNEMILIILKRVPDAEVLEIYLNAAAQYEDAEIVAAMVKNERILRYLNQEHSIMVAACEGEYTGEINSILLEAVPDYCERLGGTANNRSNNGSSGINRSGNAPPRRNMNRKMLLKPEYSVEIEEVSVKYEGQTVRDLTDLEDKTLMTLMCDRENLLVKSSSAFLIFYRTRIEMEVVSGTSIRYECLHQLSGAPYKTDVKLDEEYVLLRGEATFLVRLDELAMAMAKYAVIELVDSGKTLTHSASRASVQDTPGRNLDGRGVDIVSADHCQDGTDKRVYKIRGVVLTE